MYCDDGGAIVDEGGRLVGSAVAGLGGVGRRVLLGASLLFGLNCVGGGGAVIEGGGIVGSKLGGRADDGLLVDDFGDVGVDSTDGGRVVETLDVEVDTVASRARTCLFSRASILVICDRLS